MGTVLAVFPGATHGGRQLQGSAVLCDVQSGQHPFRSGPSDCFGMLIDACIPPAIPHAEHGHRYVAGHLQSGCTAEVPRIAEVAQDSIRRMALRPLGEGFGISFRRGRIQFQRGEAILQGLAVLVARDPVHRWIFLRIADAHGAEVSKRKAAPVDLRRMGRDDEPPYPAGMQHLFQPVSRSGGRPGPGRNSSSLQPISTAAALAPCQ